MYLYTGLTKAQCRTMVDKHSIYMSSDGMMWIPGINNKNVEHVARAMLDVMHNVRG